MSRVSHTIQCLAALGDPAGSVEVSNACEVTRLTRRRRFLPPQEHATEMIMRTILDEAPHIIEALPQETQQCQTRA